MSREILSDFDEMTSYLSREARWYALSAMVAVFHNQGHYLSGNTESSDVAWFARVVGNALDYPKDWDHTPAERQAELMKIAEATLHHLPGLCERIAHRYQAMAKAVRTMEEVARREVEQAREKTR